MEARYEERIRACSSEEELAEYLLSCVPVIKEYTSEVEGGGDTLTKKVAVVGEAVTELDLGAGGMDWPGDENVRVHSADERAF